MSKGDLLPYIDRGSRYELDYADSAPINPGQLNYKLTQLINEYLAHNGERYQQYNDVVGALECCKLELYRRLIAPHEDQAIDRNGDVY